MTQTDKLPAPAYVAPIGRKDGEAKMQSHLTEWEVRKAIRDYVESQYGVDARNIKVTDDGATYET